MNSIGHEAIVSMLSQAADQGRLSHAYCFVGPEHIGKETVATCITARLVGVNPRELSTSPDVMLIERLQDEKTGKTKKDISIDQMKEVSRFMAQSAMRRGGHKIVIVREAEKMNQSASNALLKTLEEPTENSHIFLLTTNDTELLPTIRSRCHMIRFSPVALTSIETHMRELGANEADAEELARLSRGLPGLAISWYHTSDTFTRYKEEVRRFADLFQKTFHQKVALVDDVFGDKSDAIGTRDEIKDTLAIWRLLLRDMWVTDQGKKDLAIHRLVPAPITRAQFMEIDAHIAYALRMIDKNIHPRLLIEQILLHIP